MNYTYGETVHKRSGINMSHNRNLWFYLNVLSCVPVIMINMTYQNKFENE